MRPLNVGPLGLKRDVGNGKDSGQKPRRIHASAISKCCSKGSGVRLGLRT